MSGRGRVRSMVVVVTAIAAGLSACGGGGGGGDDAVGTWAHPEEGTIVLSDDGTGSITQSSDPVEFDWDRDGDVVEFRFSFGDGELGAAATVDGDDMTFRPGDFSGDEPVTFTRE